VRKIYLASDSKARKDLFDFFGVKFKVIPSRVREDKKPVDLSYEDLVKRNALNKARGVTDKIKNGVVVAADTIVVQDKKVFGKPKNLKEARLMLKTLSGKPQWIYTGIAVVDKENNKTKVDCERTKIYMDEISGKEIDNYFASVNPLDKAGSFDIQGKGAFFIRRIEGCFYNVVGLPLRRLYRMFSELGINLLSAGGKKFKIYVFFFFFLPFSWFSLAGCSTEYNVVTGQEEMYFYSTDKEVQLGMSIVKEIEKEYELVEDPLIQKRVEEIGRKIAAVCDRQDVKYSFKVLEDEEVNAVSLPGGFIYINKGVVDKAADDDELAAVLAHEVGHIVARHSIKKLQAIMGYSILRVLAGSVSESAQVGSAADIAFTEILLGYGREDELLADQLACRYAKRAGYDPYAMIRFLEKLQDINKRRPLRPKSYFKTHPYVPDRVRVVKQELGEKIDFNDYINIEDVIR